MTSKYEIWYSATGIFNVKTEYYVVNDNQSQEWTSTDSNKQRVNSHESQAKSNK